jgi:acetyltransferase-like isoleucine patch superfamily enzyme
MKFQIPHKNVLVEADYIKLGDNVTWGNDVQIKVRGTFEIGDNSHIGDRFQAQAETIVIGQYFYNHPTDSRGMIVGGGSSGFPQAHLRIGDRCTCHTGHINLARPVTLGDDVGLSHDVDILTHGFWGSVLEGHPAIFKPVSIGNNVIVGWKSVILPGVQIADNVVIGAHSTISKSLPESGIYVGSPAHFIRGIERPTLEVQQALLSKIVQEFTELLMCYKHPPLTIHAHYPVTQIQQLFLDVEKMSCWGEHDTVTDAFRDHLRRYGIRIFHPRGFQFKLERIK